MFGRKSPEIWLIAGLGNPGLQYEKTRHNAGFMAVDLLAEKHALKFTKHKFEAVLADGTLAGKRVLLVKPQTYMNNSGRALAAITSFYKIPTDHILILFDDISLDVGKIRLRRKGSAGGHNGIKDIIECLGTEELMRIKIGVGERAHHEDDLKDWVLSALPAAQKEEMEKALENACLAAEEILKNGIDSAMNRYSS